MSKSAGLPRHVGGLPWHVSGLHMVPGGVPEHVSGGASVHAEGKNEILAKSTRAIPNFML